MSYFIFVGALLFFIYPNVSKKGISFVDIFILFCLYFDAMSALGGSQRVNLSYFQHFLVLAFSLYYFSNHFNLASKFHKRILLTPILFLLITLLFPIIKGAEINQTIRDFSRSYATLIILPISFHYYSQRGDIVNLFKSGYYFIIVWSLVVIIFTILKIDTTTPDQDRLGSVIHSGGIFYFGDMSQRGALTYIGFALLLVPLIYSRISKRKKIVALAGSGFLLAVIFIALKRFTIVAIILGIINYVSKSSLSVKLKTQLVVGVILLGVLLIFTTNIQNVVVQRYEARGGERKFGIEAITSDLRVFEPLYAFKSVSEKSFSAILFGTDFERDLDIDSERHTVHQRQIHNTYAGTILRFGLLGLLSYLSIFIVLYMITARFRKRLLKRNINVNEYWVVFQNLVLIFMAEGMVGGHIHITLRAIVLLFAGGISGYFYKLLNQNIIKS